MLSLSCVQLKAPTQDKPLSLFTAIFAVVTVVWLFFNLVFSGVWWQMTFGREIVTVTPQELILWWRPFGQRRRFRLAEVKNLRVLEDTFSVFANLCEVVILLLSSPLITGQGRCGLGRTLTPLRLGRLLRF